jgi:multisubunit Na+/H+ antiporter MnhF subunit
MSNWFKRAALVLVLLGFLDVMVPLAWQLVRPAATILLLTGAALLALIRLLKRPSGW